MGEGNLILRPGTILLLAIIAVFGYGVFTWASGNISTAGNQNLENQQNVLECSTVDVEFIDLTEEENTTRVSFQVNKNSDRVQVSFRGSKNRTRSLNSVEKGSLTTVKVNGTDYSDVIVTVGECGNFSYR